MDGEAYNARVLEELVAIRKKVDQIERNMSAQATGGAPTGQSGGTIASDFDLDSQYGDPLIKYDPKSTYWSGQSFAGYKFSETTPEYLDAMARYLDACAHMASRDADEKKRKSGTYKAKDAARARGWAARMRAGLVQPAPAQAPAGGGGDYDGTDSSYDSAGADDDIPFARAESRWWTP